MKVVSLLVPIVITAKFGLPLLLFSFPFQASWTNFVLDAADGDVLMHFGMGPVMYQNVGGSCYLHLHGAGRVQVEDRKIDNSAIYNTHDRTAHLFCDSK